MNKTNRHRTQWLLALAATGLLAACGDDPGNSDPDDTSTEADSSTDGDTDTDTDTDSDADTDTSSDSGIDTDVTVDGQASPYIVVDQFGYRTGSEKLAVIRDPVEGFDSDESFTPGTAFALVDAASGGQVFTGSPAPWNSGATDASSGDRAWWFDFSEVTTPGMYYVLDVEQNVRSDVFAINDSVYAEVLKQAMRTFFYQRVGFAKQAPFADAAWADEASHLGPLQDLECRRYNAATEASTSRDLSGGWYDAGDYNKYTSWTASYVISMLNAYVENPTAWGDDFNIPESGNGIPDIIDEAKWGMDHLIRLQNTDGSMLSVVGLDHGSPPSSADGQSLYGTENTSGTLSGAAAFAQGAIVFGATADWGLSTYAADLLARAEDAWTWADANPDVLFYNNSADHGTSGLAAGQQETDDYGRLSLKVEAAARLFAATGDTTYRDYFDNNYENINMMQWTYVFPYQERQQDTLLYYASLPGATTTVAADIHSTYLAAFQGGDNMPSYTGNMDPYGAYLDSYTWGSNSTKSLQGSIFRSIQTYGLDAALTESATRAAERYIHYIHGVNPLGMVYLSNMYDFGAVKSVNEFFHSWFANDSADWDRVGESTYGPAPGFLTGGPNPSYDIDGCCATSTCGSVENNALCTSISVEPPRNQPAQKSYLDFNDSWPLNSWAVTENSCGYQIAYIRLLSKFVD